MKAPVFTPLAGDSTRRLRFDLAEVTVVSGSIDQRGPGRLAEVEIRGQRYRVVGTACSLPWCYCDARVYPVDPV